MNEEATGARVALATGPAAKLIVDPHTLVESRSHYIETAKSCHGVALATVSAT